MVQRRCFVKLTPSSPPSTKLKNKICISNWCFNHMRPKSIHTYPKLNLKEIFFNVNFCRKEPAPSKHVIQKDSLWDNLFVLPPK
jgi:hypothetical protein